MSLPLSPRILTAALVIAALAAIVSAGGSGGWMTVHFVAKPLATILILAIAATATPPVSPRYRRAIALGLLLSLAGDVLLMLPGDRFVPGLVAFLLAHLCYITAFMGESRLAARPVAFAGYAAVSATLLASLLPALPRPLVAPVIVYVAVITTMAAQAAVWMLTTGDGQARRAAIGGAWFVVSDATLAIDRFRTDVPYRELIVLGTYFVAQWHLARSVSRQPRLRVG